MGSRGEFPFCSPELLRLPSCMGRTSRYDARTACKVPYDASHDRQAEKGGTGVLRPALELCGHMHNGDYSACRADADSQGRRGARLGGTRILAQQAGVCSDDERRWTA